MSPYNKELIRKRFAKHLSEYNRRSVVQLEICMRMQKLLSKFLDYDFVNSGKAYEIGAGTGFLTKILLNEFPTAKWLVNDLVEETKSYLNNIIVCSEANSVECVFNDAENEPMPMDLRLIASASAVQWFDSLPNFIENSFANLQKGGYLVFSTFGEQNFSQIKQLTGVSTMSYHTQQEVLDFARKSNFEVLFSEAYTTDMFFKNPYEVLRYIKETGINGNSNMTWTKSIFEDFCKDYTKMFSTTKGVTLTYQPLIFVLRKN